MRRKERSTKQLRDSVPEELEEQCLPSVKDVLLFAAPWNVAHQAPVSLGFSRQEYRSGLPMPSPGDLPDPGIEHGAPALQVDSCI